MKLFQEAIQAYLQLKCLEFVACGWTTISDEEFEEFVLGYMKA